MKKYLKMKPLIFTILILTFSLSGCLKNNFKGLIGAKYDENHRILVIQNVKKEELEDKEISEIIKLAQDKNGIWFGISEEKYKQLNVGDQVRITYPQNPDILTSDPPIIGADTVNKLDD